MSQSLQTSPDAAPAPRPASRLSIVAQCVMGVIFMGFLESRYPGTIRALVAFLVTLSILVFVHELGHFQFARWAGMKVNRFALGFPPFIFNREKNGIIYSIGALPIGGMVDIAGLGSEEEMVAQSRERVDELLERSNIGAETDHVAARAQVYRDSSRPFGQKQYQDANLFWRFMVIFAGPLMNFIFAILVAIGLFCVAGFPNYDHANSNSIAMAMGGSPAAKAGIQPGDMVLSVNGTPTTQEDKIRDILRGSGGKPVTLQMQRDGQPLELKLQPEMKTVPAASGKTETVPTIGVLFDVDPKTVTYDRVGVVDATQKAFIVSANMTAQVVGLIQRAVTFKLTDIDKASIGGPVKIAQQAGRASRQGGLRQSIMMAIGLSMNLGLMNLLPLPALDGGRIMFLGYELVARRPFNPKWEGLVHAAGMIMLLTFMLFITLRDVNAGALLEHFKR